MLWKMKAITLLQMVGMEGADQAKLAKECTEHTRFQTSCDKHRRRLFAGGGQKQPPTNGLTAGLSTPTKFLSQFLARG